MKEYPISFLVRLQQRHKNIIKKIKKKTKASSEAAVVRAAIELLNERNHVFEN